MKLPRILVLAVILVCGALPRIDIKGLYSAKIMRRSSRAGQEAVLAVKSVQDGVRHNLAWPVETMPTALHMNG
jgi:hypothetical protein